MINKRRRQAPTSVDELIKQLEADIIRYDKFVKRLQWVDWVMQGSLALLCCVSVYKGIKTGRFEAFQAFVLGINMTQLFYLRLTERYRARMHDYDKMVMRQQEIIRGTIEAPFVSGNTNDWRHS